MTDDRIGIYGKPKPKLTIGGNPVQEQYRCIVGLGNGRYVIVGYSDSGYEDEVIKLKGVKREVASGQKDTPKTRKQL